MVSWLTVAICLLAAVIETGLASASTSSLSPADIIVLIFLIGPYMLFGLFAWLYRRNKTVARVMLAIVIGVAVCGLYAVGLDSYRYYTDPEYARVQRLIVPVVALVQWCVVAVVALWLLGVWLVGRHRAKRI